MKLLPILFFTAFVGSGLLSAQNSQNNKPTINENKAHFSADNKADVKPLSGVFLAIQFDDTAFSLRSWDDLKGKEKNIREILVQKRNLQSLPKELLALRNIELIDLSSNQLKDIDFAFFKNFPKLKRLYLNNNLISTEALNQFAEKNPHIQVFYLQEHFK